MSFISQILKKIKYRYQLHIKRDPFLLEVQRWFSDNGDQTLRLDYDLNKSSIYFDIGHGKLDVIQALNQQNSLIKIGNVQTQFHNFVKHAAEERAKLRESMRAMHAETWRYEFVWENWQRLKVKCL